MAVPIDSIVATLRADPVLVGLATGGIWDHDPRRSNATLVTDDSGDVLPYLAVDDAGGGADPFSRLSSVFSDRVMVWMFAPRYRPGRLAITAMTDRTLALLHQWQDPETGTQLFAGNRLGLEETDAPDSSYMDRLTFKVAGVVAVAW